MLRVNTVRPANRTTASLSSNKGSARASRYTSKSRGPSKPFKPLSGIPALCRRVVAGASSGEAIMGGIGGGGAGKPPIKKTGGEGHGHDDFFFMFGEWWISIFNKFAALLLVYKGIQATYFCFLYAFNDGCGCVGSGEYYNKARIVLGRGVLISLEFLLISDILETMLFGANLDRLIVIGVTATIRTMIDYFTSKEIEEAEHALDKLEQKGHAH